MSAYVSAGAREALIGAVSGAIFGPFGAGEALAGKMLIGGVTNGFESVLRQTLEGKGIDFKTVLFDMGVGTATGGLFHGAGKLFEKASPFVKNAFNKVSSELSENARIAKIALSNMNKGPKPVVLGSNLGNLDEAIGRFAKEFKNVKNAGSEISEQLKGEEIFGPYYDEAKQLLKEDPEFFCDPDVCTIRQGEELKKARSEYNKLSNRGKLSKGHHIQGLAFGGENVESNIVHTGESTISRAKLTNVQQEEYANPKNGYTKNKDFKVAKITEDPDGEVVRNQVNYKFGLNDRHTRATVFQNKVLDWQREVGLRTD